MENHVKPMKGFDCPKCGSGEITLSGHRDDKWKCFACKRSFSECDYDTEEDYIKNMKKYEF